MAITLRLTKGSPLTYNELDENFIFLSSSYVPNSLTGSIFSPIQVTNTTIYSSTPLAATDYSQYGSLLLGQCAGERSTNSAYSVIIGTYSGYYATNSCYSNFIGSYSGYYATNSCYSNFLGVSSGYNATNACFSNFIGSYAGCVASAAGCSNFIGYSAGNMQQVHVVLTL